MSRIEENIDRLSISMDKELLARFRAQFHRGEYSRVLRALLESLTELMEKNPDKKSMLLGAFYSGYIGIGYNALGELINVHPGGVSTQDLEHDGRGADGSDT